MLSILTNVRVLFGSLVILGAAAALMTGATGAFFSDTEVSTGNTFAAGALDLKVDNDSYYNGNRCAEVTAGIWQWQGSAPYPVSGTPCTTSWTLTDLTDGHLFFNFLDLKPDDEGEDTISLHIQNDAWACMELTLNNNDDNSTTEPEGQVDKANDEADFWDGELAQNIEFVWWADDGDNVLEQDENIISDGVQTLLALAPQSGSWKVALADASTNVWGGTGPLLAGGTHNGTHYIGKAWCFGNLEPSPVPADTGVNPSINSGITCDGTLLNNETQTDGAQLDIKFVTEQARHNPSFLCEQNRLTTLTLVKNLINDDVGTATSANFTLSADGPTDISGTSGSGAVTNAVVLPGAYTLSETQLVGYSASNWSCVVNGGAPVVGNNINLNEGDVAVCTITNDDTDTIACTPEFTYADSIVSSNQGVRKNNTAVNLDRSDPADALGAPQSLGTPFDNPVVAGSFFSLGFDEGTDQTPNEGGWVIVEFNNNYVIDGPGNDIRAWEVTGGTSYPVEKLKVEVSQDGTTWYVADPSLLRDEEADMDNTPIDWARYVRLTDVSTRAEFEATADGYDLDAVSALNCARLPQEI